MMTHPLPNKTILRVLLAGVAVLILCGAVVGAAGAEVVTDNYRVSNTGDTPYSTLSGAYAVATEGATITVVANVTETAQTTMSDAKSVTLDLNGKTIIAGDAFSDGLIKWNSSGKLTITDSSSGDPGKLNGAKKTRVLYIAAGTVEMKKGSITGGSAEDGGGVYVAAGGSFTMNGGTIGGSGDDKNTARRSGGGVFVTSISSSELYGTFTLNSGNIIGNTAGNNGGGVYVNTSSTFEMKGGNITGNEANGTGSAFGGGGGVFVKGTFEMKGGRITGNTANYGGGVRVKEGTFNVSGAPMISENTDKSNSAKANNVSLPSGKTITIDMGTEQALKGLADGCSIAVTSEATFTTNVQITTAGAAGYAKYFTSDDRRYGITADNDNNLYLTKWAIHGPASLEHGSLTISSDSSGSPEITTAAASAAVYLVFTPESGYGIRVKDITVSGVTSGTAAPEVTEVSDNVFTFKMPADGVNIVAAFEPVYTVTFDMNGHGGTAPASQSVFSGEKAAKPEDPSETGYTFGGWYEDQGCTGNAWNFETGTVTGNTTLFAKWTANTYTVTLNPQGGTGGTASITAAYDSSAHDQITNPTLADKVFSGWYTDATDGSLVIDTNGIYQNVSGYVEGRVWKRAENTELFAHWTDKVAQSITKGTMTNGDVTISSDEAGTTVIERAVEGTTVYLKPAAATGYTYTADSLAVTDKDGNTVATEAATTPGVYKFTMPDSAVTVTAAFTANTYKVKFDANGGSGTAMADQTFTYDVAQNLSKNTYTRTGYAFDGWAESAGGDVKYADEASVINLTSTAGGTVILYAHWTTSPAVVNKVTVTPKDAYVGGSVTVTVEGTQAGNATVTYPASLGGTTENITLVNVGGTPTWTSSPITVAAATAAAGEIVSAKGTTQTQAIESAAFHAYTKALKVTASSSSVDVGNNVNFTVSIPLALSSDLNVTLADNSSTATGISGLPQDLTISAGQTSVTTATPVKATGAGNLIVQAIDKDSVFSDGGATVTVTVPTLYTITTSVPSGHGTITVSPSSATAGTKVTITPAADSGYQLSSLTAKQTSGGTAVPVAADHTFTMPAAAVTVTAVFEVIPPATATVTFNVQGHGTAPASQTIDIGSKVTRPADPSEYGYTFGGWYKESDCINEWNFESDTVQGDMTLYAKWTINTYIVTFDVQGHGVPPAGQIVNYGEKVIEPADPSAEGLTFDGWYTDAACTTPWYFETGTVTEDMTLYAKWVHGSYTITFNGNGGTFSIQTKTVRFGDTVLLSDVTIVKAKEGYTHSGWAVTPDGKAVYAAKQMVQDLGDITLYAVWTKDAEVIRATDVKVMSEDGTPLSGVTVQLKEGNAVLGYETTSGDGLVSFRNQIKGTYNLVAATKDGKVVTTVVPIPYDAQPVRLIIPDKDISSVVDVSVKAGTPAVIVDGVSEAAAKEAGEADSAVLTVKIEAKVKGDKATTEKETQKEIEKIIAISGGSELQYLGITVEKSENGGEPEPVLTTQNVLKFTIPYDFTGKKQIKLFRCHGDEAKQLKEITPEDKKEDGTYILDKDNGRIYLYADKFSVYSVGYITDSGKRSHSNPGSSYWATETPTPTPTPTPTHTSTPTPDVPTVKPVASETTKPAASPVPLAGLLAGLGAAAVAVRMRRK